MGESVPVSELWKFPWKAQGDGRLRYRSLPVGPEQQGQQNGNLDNGRCWVWSPSPVL